MADIIAQGQFTLHGEPITFEVLAEGVVIHRVELKFKGSVHSYIRNPLLPLKEDIVNFISDLEKDNGSGSINS
jgi:hypothetical protein